MIELMKGHEASPRSSPPTFAEHGLPLPGAGNPQAADLVLSADGYAFSNTAAGDVARRDQPGHRHDRPPRLPQHEPEDERRLHRLGPRDQAGAKVDLVENIDIAPTAAHLLGHEMKDVDGKVLTEILETPAKQ